MELAKCWMVGHEIIYLGLRISHPHLFSEAGRNERIYE
jgi:hypothetical protein